MPTVNIITRTARLGVNCLASGFIDRIRISGVIEMKLNGDCDSF
jgi:hypothetical protein